MSVSPACSWALAYSGLGYYVFPCRPDKKPFTAHGFKDATTDQAVVRAFWQEHPDAQIGIDCERSGIVVADLDKKNGKDGIAAFETMRGTEPHDCSLVVSTPTGGRHFVYGAFNDIAIKSTVDQIALGIDTRACGGYVIAPSPASPGRECLEGTWLELKPADLARPPAWLLEHLPRRGAADIASTAHPEIPQLERDRIEIASALHSIPPTVCRSVWMQAIFAVHAKASGNQYGADLVEGWSALSDKVLGSGRRQYVRDEATRIYNGATLPEDSPNRALIHSGTLFALARSYGWRAAGNADGETQICPLADGATASPRVAPSTSEQEPAEPPTAIARLWKPLRSLSIPPTPRRWLLRHPTLNGQPAAPGAGDGLLLRGKAGQLVSAGGTGKTVALIQLAVALVVRGSWLGHFLPDDSSGRILLGLAEEDADEVHRRMHAACAAMGLSDHELELVERHCTTLALSGEEAALLTTAKGKFVETKVMKELRQRLHDEAGAEGWAALILDPLSRWGGLNTDVDASAATRSVQAFESLTKVPGNPAVMVAQHSSKLARRTGTVDSRGSTALTDGFRWEGSLLAKDGFVYFKQEKSNYSRPMDGQGIPLQRGEGGILHVVPHGDLPSANAAARAIQDHLANNVDRVADAMREFGRAASSIDQICAIAGIGKTPGRPAVRQALSLGRLVDQTPKGKLRTFVVPDLANSTPEHEGGEDPHTPAAGAGVEAPAATAANQRPRAPKRRPTGAGVQAIDDGRPEQPRKRRRRAEAGGA